LPSSRAFSRRRSEAGSVFSRSLSSAIHAPNQHWRSTPCSWPNYWIRPPGTICRSGPW